MRTFRSAVSNFNRRLTLTHIPWFRQRRIVFLPHQLVSAIQPRFKAGLSVLLLISLLCTSAPAAPLVITSLTSEMRMNLGFWLQSSGFINTLNVLLKKQPDAPEPQEKQEERDGRVVKVDLYPSKVTLHAGEPYFLSAIAYSSDGTPVGGVQFKWQIDGIGNDPKIKISPNGEFRAEVEGTYRVTVEGAGRTAHSVVKVKGTMSPEGAPENKRIKKISSQDFPLVFSTKADPSRSEVKGAHYSSTAARAINTVSPTGGKSKPAALAMAALQSGVNGDPYGWNSSNAGWASSPLNERGNTPGRSTAGGAASGNFNLTAPIVSLPGRGLDLNLSLYYHSRLWSRTDSKITLDIDNDPVALGWSFGLSKIVNMVDSGAILMESDGTRHSFAGSLTTDLENGTRTFTASTTDGSRIEYVCTTKNFGTPDVTALAYVVYPNGTMIAYTGKQDPNSPANVYNLYPVTIMNPNGNFIIITYENFRIKTMSDTLGRIVTFYYDSNNLLTAITAGGLKDENGNPTTRTLVRLTYRTLTLDYGFSGLTPVVRNPSPVTVPVLNAIYYPGMGTGYWFGDADSYSSYGMLRKVSEQRGMSFSNAPLNEQGIVYAGLVTKECLYNYPLTRDDSLTDAPTYSSVTETWEGSDTGPAVINYNFQTDANTRTATITLPDQTKAIQYSYNHPGQLDDGLLYREERRDGSNTLLQSSTLSWEPGSNGGFRIKQRTLTDERNQTRKIVYDYTVTDGNYSFDNVYELREYGYNNELLRKTKRTFKNIVTGPPATTNSPPYPQILGLVASEEVFAPDDTSVSYVEYEYDNYHATGGYITPVTSDLVRVTGVTHFSSGYYDPYFLSYYPTFGVWNRGNLTSVMRYTDAANRAGPMTTKFIYDITGNLLKITSPGDMQKSFSFTADTQYAYPTTETQGSPDPNSTARMTTNRTYDFNTGLELSATDANARATQAKYASDTWRPTQTLSATGASTRYSFNDNGLSYTETTYTDGGATDSTIAARSISRLNGRGQVWRQEALAGVNTWDAVETKYDSFGRVWRQSRPFRSTVAQNDIRWSENFYDYLGRVSKVVAPDGSTTRNVYTDAGQQRPQGASTDPGETVKMIDPWNRERWGRFNADGQLAEVIEPDMNGNGSVATGGSLTTYRYDTLGNLLEVIQGDQRRKFKYDSLGRLTHQKLAEANASLDDNGNRVAGGNWSDVYVYDERSNLSARIDARGVKTDFSFFVPNTTQLDPLNRLRSVSYETQGSPNVLPAAKVSYNYCTSGDVTRLQSVTTEAVSTETFDYDLEGRMREKTLTLASRPAFPLLTTYQFDTLNRVTDIWYPKQYGVGTAPRKDVHQDYDVASRLSGLKVDQAAYASEIIYNPSSQAQSLKIGSAGPNQITENYGYNEISGLLESQTVVRGAGQSATALLNLTYNYDGPNGQRTGQLRTITNNLDASHNRDRSYSYDALGRLKQAAGGPAAAPIWTQTYTYDRYGNRTGVTASGHTASLAAPEMPQPTLPTQQLALNINPIPSPEALREDGASNMISDSPLRLGWPSVSNEKRAEAGAGRNAASAMASILEPQSSSPSLSVTSVSASLVNLSWTAATGAVDHYEIERAQSISGPYTFLFSTNATTCQDTSVSAGVAYLYRVRAVYAGGGSTYSNVPVATTVVFADATLEAGTTIIQARHLNDLRQAINALRVAGGLAAFSWADAALTGVQIKATHVQQLRTNLAQALTALGSSTLTYSDPVLSGMPVRKAHIDELRQFVRGATANGGSILPPASPTALAASAISSSQINLTWTDNSANEDGFQIERKTGANGTYTQIASVGAGVTSYSSTGLSASTVYYYRLRAYNTAGDSPYSNAASATTTVVAVPPDGAGTLSYDTTTNRITTTGFTYDDAGNQTQIVRPDGSIERFQYDAAGRLVKVKNGSDQTIAIYTYGNSRRRLITQLGNESSNLRTYYVWGAEDVESEFIESDVLPTSLTWSKSYFYLGSTLLATQEPGASGEVVQFHHPDQLGTRVVTNPAFGSSFEQHNLPFGTALDAESTGSTNRRFTSYDRSPASGLDYAVNRFYDSAQGRFTQVDPIGMQASSLFNPQSLNLYAYCGNDPVNSIDPSGTWGFTISWGGGSPFGGGQGGSSGGFLGGLFSFGLGLLGTLLQGQPHSPMSPHILGTGFLGQPAIPQQPPTSSTVALAGNYNDEHEREHGGRETFRQRAIFTAGNINNVGIFTTGAELLSQAVTLSNRVGTIGRLYIYSHAFEAGIVGFSGNSEGLYIEDRNNKAYQTVITRENYPPFTWSQFYDDYFSGESRNRGMRSSREFAELVLNGSINIATGGEIAFYGCNTDSLASHVQYILSHSGDRSRPDIRVTGASGNVTLANPSYAETGPGRWNTYTGSDNRLEPGSGRITRRRYR